MLILGGAVLLLFALLSMTGSPGGGGRKRVENTLLGALAVAAMVFALFRAGLPWLAVGLAVLWSAARRFGEGRERAPSKRTAGRGEDEGRTTPLPSRSPMTREEALQVLGLDQRASREEIASEYRRLMKKVHPDQGGTTYLATRLNEAKAVLLGG